MSNATETKFTIRAVNKTQVAFSQIKRSVDNLDRKFGRLGSMLTTRIAPAFAAVFAGREIIDTITKFERLEASLKTVTGSAEKAAQAFKAIDEFAAKTPFQLEEVTRSFIKLKALGLTPSERALKSYGNTAIAMGKSLDQMIEAVADATTGEFERLKEFGIKAKTQGDQVIFTFQGVSTAVGKNAAEIEAYLLSLGEVQFAGAIEAKASTLVNAIAKMKDAFAKLIKAIGDAGVTECFIKIANGIRWLIEQITESIEPIVYWSKYLTNEITKFGNLFVAVLK
jgi:phage tail tape-measure protein